MDRIRCLSLRISARNAKKCFNRELAREKGLIPVYQERISKKMMCLIRVERRFTRPLAGRDRSVGGKSGVAGGQMETTKYVIFRCIAASFFAWNIDNSHEKHLISGIRQRYSCDLLSQYSLQSEERQACYKDSSAFQSYFMLESFWLSSIK